MFAYCNNNPVHGYDPTGHFYCGPQSKYSYLGDNGNSGSGGGSAGAVIGIVELVENSVEGLLSVTEISIAIQASRESSNEGNHFVYVLYEESDGGNKVQYVGRTMDPGKRKAAHKNNPFRRDLEFMVVGSNLSYAQARGLEQILMLYYHTHNTANMMHNQINGISPHNDAIDIYLEAAKGALGYAWNQLSNEVLNWLNQ